MVSQIEADSRMDPHWIEARAEPKLSHTQLLLEVDHYLRSLTEEDTAMSVFHMLQ